MSYDIYLDINTGKTNYTVCEVGGHTSNTSNMWHKALGYSLADLDGKLAGDYIEDLRKAVANMEDNRPEYLPMNPSNGWGSYETALKYLKDFRDACIEHPLCTIDISH